MHSLRTQNTRLHPARRIPLWPEAKRSAANKPYHATRIPFHTQRGIVFIDPDLVTHLRALSNYTQVHYLSGKSLLLSKTLKYCAAQFPGNFVRIHQSYLINPAFIHFYSKSDHAITLDSGVVLPVSRSGKKLLPGIGDV